jgi:hypothetical protein
VPGGSPNFTRVGDSAQRIPPFPRPTVAPPGVLAFPEPPYVLASLAEYAWETAP